MKRPGAMKLALLKLKTIVQHEQIDGGPTASLNEGPSQHDGDSESDKESLGHEQEESIIL